MESNLNLSLVYICIAVGYSIIKKGVGFSLTSEIPPYFRACPKTGPEFQTSYVVGLFMFNDLR